MTIYYAYFKCPRCKTNNTPGPLIEDHQLYQTEYDRVMCQECFHIYRTSRDNHVFTSRKSKATKEDDYNQIDPMEE